LMRKETRGHHFRPDFPMTSEAPQHTLVRKKDHTAEVSYTPVRRLNPQGDSNGGKSHPCEDFQVFP
jgi:hypothetical protein